MLSKVMTALTLFQFVPNSITKWKRKVHTFTKKNNIYQRLIEKEVETTDNTRMTDVQYSQISNFYFLINIMLL